jgi:hypothetical protein
MTDLIDVNIEFEWKVVCHYRGYDETHVVKGWKPILALLRQSEMLGVRYVDVGPKIGPWLRRFVMR